MSPRVEIPQPLWTTPVFVHLPGEELVPCIYLDLISCTTTCGCFPLSFCCAPPERVWPIFSITHHTLGSWIIFRSLNSCLTQAKQDFQSLLVVCSQPWLPQGLSVRLIVVQQCLSGSWGHKTGCRAPDVGSQVLLHEVWSIASDMLTCLCLSSLRAFLVNPILFHNHQTWHKIHVDTVMKKMVGHCWHC